MSRNVDDPNERIRLRLGRRSSQTPDSEQPEVLTPENVRGPATQDTTVESTPTIEQSDRLTSQVAKQQNNQSSNIPNSQLLNTTPNQRSNMLETEQVNIETPLQADSPDSEPVAKLNNQSVNVSTPQQAKSRTRKQSNKSTSQQSNQPTREHTAMLTNSLTSNLTSQRVNESAMTKKKDREQQAVYLSPEQRMLLKFLAPLENRELSDIVADALDLYFEHSPYKQVLQMVLQAQQQHEVET